MHLARTILRAALERQDARPLAVCNSSFRNGEKMPRQSTGTAATEGAGRLKAWPHYVYEFLGQETRWLMRFARWYLLLLLACLATFAAGPPKRIISASPNITEILYGVGAFDRVVAVSDYCTYPLA